jgi:hypothetical protein
VPPEGTSQPDKGLAISHADTSANEILSEVAATSPTAARLTPTQAAGMQLAWAVGSVITVVILFVCVDWVLMLPKSQPIGTSTRDVIDNYKEMRDYATDDASKLFDLIVSKALLPVFTAVLGYIFGSRHSAAHSKEES